MDGGKVKSMEEFATLSGVSRPTLSKYFNDPASVRQSTRARIEKALERIAKHPIRVIGAGRTDTGVHASGQVIAFDLLWKHPAKSLLKALNVNLPDDIIVLDLEKTSSHFHPRFDALSRQYRYTILNIKNKLLETLQY